MSSSDHLDEFIAQGSAALAAGDLIAASEATQKGIPVHNLMGLSFVRVDADATVMAMELTDNVKGFATGGIHGGLLATFADVASATALTGAYDPATHITVTTDLHVRYYRQPTAGPLTATATVVHRGRRLLSTECVVADAQDRVLARSTATYMLVPWA